MKNFIIVLFILFVATNCREEPATLSNCNLKPDGGPCYAYFIKYYYDKKEERCKEFIWGGCKGVVPFETLDDCKRCEGSL